MTASAATILVFLALGCCVGALFPQLPEKYLLSVAGILICAALLIGARG